MDDKPNYGGAPQWNVPEKPKGPVPIPYQDRADGTRFVPIRPGDQWVNPERRARKRVFRGAEGILGRKLTKRERKALKKRLTNDAVE